LHFIIIMSVVDSCASLKGEGLDEVVCACCGVAEVDDVKLKICDGGCDLVKYCSDNCQELHRGQHEEVCKQRKAEMHDKQLFMQPDISYKGECPICCLPLPLLPSKSKLNTCCSKSICLGCSYANKKREIEAGLERRCVYCREPMTESDEEHIKRMMERVKKNDPVAMTEMGKEHTKEGNYGKALEYYTKAAELGNAEAHFCLGGLYFEGDGVEKDKEKEIHHLEQAAIGGHPGARGILANYEMENGRFERAAKHWIIAANLGYDISLKVIKDFFMEGILSKEEYAAALRGYQAAVNALKSVDREKAEEAIKTEKAYYKTLFT
jgi:tetratricopeptide (TPR) repeat protein